MDSPESIEVLTKKEVVAIRKLIKTMDMIESWGKLGKVVFWVLSAIAGAFIAWETISTRMVKWLAGS